MKQHLSRRGMIAYELLGCISGLSLLGALVVAAGGGVRQQHQLETTSAKLEEAQNLMARWRAGEPLDAKGWISDVQLSEGHDLLILRGYGVHLETLRPHHGGAP